jgi:hypothetical protein
LDRRVLSAGTLSLAYTLALGLYEVRYRSVDRLIGSATEDLPLGKCVEIPMTGRSAGDGGGWEESRFVLLREGERVVVLFLRMSIKSRKDAARASGAIQRVLKAIRRVV